MPFGAAMRVVRETRFAGISPAARGKVRDIYDAGDQLLIVATDRLSAFDVILPTPIPDKLMKTKIVAVVAQGDYVMVATPRPLKDSKGQEYTTTWFDMWRFVDGKADEHWDGATRQ